MSDDMDYQTKNDVERIITDVKDTTITVENYKKYFDKIENTERIINAQLENFIMKYKEINGKLKTKESSNVFVESAKDKFVPIEAYELQQDLIMVLRDIYSWKSLLAEMNNILLKKIGIVLNDVEALDIKKGALEEFREMQKERSEMEKQRNNSQIEQINKIADTMVEIVNHKMEMVDEKIMNTIKFLQLELNNDKKIMMETFISALDIDKEKKKKLLDTAKEQQVVKVNKESQQIKQAVLEPVPPVKKHVYQKLDEEIEKPLKDDNPFIDNEDDEL